MSAIEETFSSKTINQIVKDQTPCLFLSPHLDDAILSAGGLISYLTNKTEVKLVTIFTAANNGPHTLSGKRFLSLSGYSDAIKLFEDRKKEDIRVCKELNVEYRHLNFIDGLFRKRSHAKNYFIRTLGKFIPEFIHSYPVYRLKRLSAKIALADNRLKNNLRLAILKEVKKFKTKPVIFAPAAIGSHIDHMLIKSVCDELFPGTIYWSDFPYVLKQTNAVQLPGKNSLVWKYSHSLKARLISYYVSQVSAMFANGEIPAHKEIYCR